MQQQEKAVAAVSVADVDLDLDMKFWGIFVKFASAEVPPYRRGLYYLPVQKKTSGEVWHRVSVWSGSYLTPSVGVIFWSGNKKKGWAMSF